MPTKRPAVFFDRDNTLIVTNDYLGDPDRVLLYDGAASAVSRAKQLGYVVVVFSNQSGVARGMYAEEDVHKVNQRLDRLLLAQDDLAIIDRHEFCPDHPAGTVEPYNRESPRRKPSPGMMLDAARALEIDLTLSWTVGDAPRDVEAGRRAGCRTILLKDPAVPASLAASEKLTVEPDYIAASLEDAMDFIEMHKAHGKPIGPELEVEPTTQQEHAADVATNESDSSATNADGFFPPRASESSSGEDSVDQSDSAGTAIVATPRPTPVFLTPPIFATPPVSSMLAPPSTSANQDASSSASTSPGTTDRVTIDPLIKELKTLQRQQTQIIDELRHMSDKPQDFSVARLVAGIMLGLSMAALVGSWFYKGDPTQLTLLLLAIWFQVGVASLMLMANGK